MTVDQWAVAQSGIVLKVPKGTRTGRVIHEYQLDTGEWVTDPKAHGANWSQLSRRMRYEETDRDHYVEVGVSAGTLVLQALKAIGNRSGKSIDGPLILRRQR